ncbi:hypothetical protein DM02DRAFT_618869 [Periconia macrospinosa]|uniref:Uncharacterized protein n=1 Tax=Periconia macrospinosa TaxID=97972 RepID=A0A2V1D7P3_9PLEO|nr:hypothetical protein DM02DRAFT_618869 [Periconia macrospinosa]
MAYPDHAYDRYDRYNYDHRRPHHHVDHERSSHLAADRQTAMNYSSSPRYSTSSYPSSYHHSYDNRYSSTAKSAKPSSYSPTHSYKRNRWPPSPSVEDEATSLAKEFPTLAGSEVNDNTEEAKSRGSVDQYPIIEELEQYNDERRFVLVTDPNADSNNENSSAIPSSRADKHGRRRSYAERGNMAPLDTNVDHHQPPVFTERTSTPYAYTKPQKESLAPSDEQYFLSPEPVTPSSSGVPRPAPRRNSRNARDQNTPAQAGPSSTDRYGDTFEDSDADSDGAHLLTEPPRRSGRYSFVKNEIQKEDLRTNVLDSQARSERRKHRDTAPSFSANRESSGTESNASSASSKHYTPPSQSPRSSSSSIAGESRKQKLPPVDTSYAGRRSRRSNSRSSPPAVSPVQQRRPSPPRSPRLSSYGPSSPSASRPSSRNGSRASSPSSFANGVPRADGRVPITESEWHARHSSTTDRARPISRPDPYDYMQAPMPQINVKSPSPSRTPVQGNIPPYPVDDNPTQAFMPPEEEYQFDHSSVPLPPSPRQPHVEYTPPNSPRMPAYRPAPRTHNPANSDELHRSPMVRSDSLKSQASYDSYRERRPAPDVNVNNPLPKCPRKEPSTQYNDWYKLDDCPGFDICPSCYEGVFALTPFAGYFSQPRRYERPTERFCDFSSPWMRIAWMITVKQRRPSLRLIQDLSAIADSKRSCPKDRELTTDQITWYGVADQRDGMHIANFAVCPCDMDMLETLFPFVRNYFTRITSNPYASPMPYTCSLRVTSRRFPRYMEVLMEIDAEAQAQGQRPSMDRFIQLARENAFKSECSRDKLLLHKPWHFIRALPEFTVCQECYEDFVWPYISSPSSTSNTNTTTLPNLFNRTIQPVPTEDPEIGTSCYLYSRRMREVWERAVREGDIAYLQAKVLERRQIEKSLALSRNATLTWMSRLERGSVQWEQAKAALRKGEMEWRLLE